jgi:hypothetical protein
MANSYVTAAPQPPKVITYLLTITSASKAKKKATKQRQSISRRIELPATEPWDTMKAQFLKEIVKVLTPLKYILITMRFHSRFCESSLSSVATVDDRRFWKFGIA